jgi:hemerythrin
MSTTNDPASDLSVNDGSQEVVWSDRYATGIELIDEQHKELISLTNRLYQACRGGNEAASVVFKEAMSRMVEYVRFHFAAEEKLQARIKYPQLGEHKKQHEEMVKHILGSANDFREGKNAVPFTFARSLKEWIFSHIAIYDKAIAVYVADLRKKGLISDDDLKIEP